MGEWLPLAECTAGQGRGVAVLEARWEEAVLVVGESRRGTGEEAEVVPGGRESSRTVVEVTGVVGRCRAGIC